MIFSCDTVSCVWPMRLAGTCSKYSNNATPQLTSAATYQGLALSSLRWAYQANVMKTFEAISSKIDCATTGTSLSLANQPFERVADDHRRSRMAAVVLAIRHIVAK